MCTCVLNAELLRSHCLLWPPRRRRAEGRRDSPRFDGGGLRRLAGRANCEDQGMSHRYSKSVYDLPSLSSRCIVHTHAHIHTHTYAHRCQHNLLCASGGLGIHCCPCSAIDSLIANRLRDTSEFAHTFPLNSRGDELTTALCQVPWSI